MAQEHGNIFEGDDPLNLDRFQPKPAGASDRPGPQELRGIAERTKFVSREGQGAAPPPVPLLRRGQHRTGRTATLTLKTTPEYSNRFYALAEAQGWLIGETFERALDALEQQITDRDHGSNPPPSGR
jgi:hypothetical protein